MIIKSLDHLNLISLKIIKKISQQDCIMLLGEIGVGKTTLTRAIINNLQIQNKQKEARFGYKGFRSGLDAAGV